MGFNYTNGFHDAANAIATSVSTRALTPRIALVMAAVANLFGAFLGTKVAADHRQRHHRGAPGQLTAWSSVAGALIGAIAWNLLTWWFGLPSSSSPRADRRARWAPPWPAGAAVKWHGVIDKVVIPMVLSPVVGLLARLSR